jgi:hypothetical protein
MDEIAKEIITADELKKYLAKQWTKRPCEYFNKVVKEFAEMKANEKVIWGLNLKFDYTSPNILLTNNGKILYIMPNDFYRNYRGPKCDKSHDFWIPPECIYTIKTLIKNICGYYTTQPHANQYDSTSYYHLNDFDAIYDNLNEYLKHLKTMMIAKNEQMEEMERMRLLINELVNEQVLEHERIKENERIRLQNEKDTLLINLLDMPLENGPQHPILSGLMLAASQAPI